ncbi:leucyl/phenylalanyl-tRNA--protein transferase [Aquabacterium sp. NJ1]|uniref:leucyl/phenylalanyl-tRNA--protein transferase n=1 Tax=Aquabacterium sp. NJ1 TaxID=1538295 RepID=UPI00052D5C4E|nr:leucyl/phenylalanyl-tRNA--protein transferase [Aquabacterium sp. NJ1]KGM39367.1 leucyl/phenylalanyl-tRNA--protein transferase [Aquabacterium sp. NJ1]
MIPWLEPDTPFPDTALALGPETDAPGLLAAGADLRPQRLEAAYRRGIFPWFSQGQPVLWWTTDPRMVLPVREFKVHRSLRKVLSKFQRTTGCEIRINSAFEQVAAACANTPRDGQNGTWILPDMQAAYSRWHRLGRVHSFETWVDGELAGGLYGVNLGRMFYGESMFAWRTDASKIALAALVCFCRANGIELIDCQQQTRHLASLGARPISRGDFEAHLRGVVDQSPPEIWAYDDVLWSQLEHSA